MSDHILKSSFKYIVVEILWDIIYFPVWWYTKGIKRIFLYCINSAKLHVTRRLALGVWLKNMFTPMFGDYTKEGRIISFFMRFFVLIWKLIATVLWLIVLLILFLLWIIFPLITIYYILYQVFDIPFLFF